MTGHITIAILAKDKAHTLPLYLRCIERLEWPKDKLFLYVRTNNNNDATVSVLNDWLDRVHGAYAGVYYDPADVDVSVEKYGQHEWNPERFRVLAKIRQDSLAWARAHESHYFVADCDNFLHPGTLKELAYTNLPIVAPLLHSSSNYSNYHAAIDANGYLAECPLYYDLLDRRICGLIEVPVVHCTYFVRHQALRHLSYDDGSGRYEYVIFSHSARRSHIPQYLDTRRSYGRISFAEDHAALIAEPWFAEFQPVLAE